MKTSKRYFLLAAAPMIAACAQASHADDALIISPLGAASPENGPGGSDPAADADARIAARVKETYLAQRTAAAADAEIDVRDGIVILSGKTVSEAHRALATAYARGVEGVKSVDNRMIVVGTEISVKSTAVDKMDDAAVTARVKAALLLHRSASAFKTKVKTKDGVVTLRGKARSAVEKDMIGKLVSNLDGVSAVDNRMTVAL
jgi:hyperosmotically inducible protein